MARVRVIGATVLAVFSVATPAVAQAPPGSTAPPATPAIEDGGQTETGGSVPDQPPPPLPLIPIPAGCTGPAPPHVVFVGTVVDRDFRTVQFEIEQVRAGDPFPFASGQLINVRYGLDAQYLDDGADYLVSAPVDPDLGILVSRVTEPVENFGGDEVIGVSESDVNCPPFDDPLRTLHLDGSAVEASVTGPFFAAKLRLLSAVLVPLAVAFGAIFLLAMLRLSLTGIYHSLARR